MTKAICSILVSITGFTVSFLVDMPDYLKLLVLIISCLSIFVGFPIIIISLSSPPLFITDIENSRFENAYILLMNIILALFLGFVIFDWGFKDILKNRAILEISALIGGNITCLFTLQNYLGKILLSACHKCKLLEESRSRRGSDELDSDLSQDPSNCAEYDTEHNAERNITVPSDLAIMVDATRTNNPLYIKT